MSRKIIDKIHEWQKEHLGEAHFSLEFFPPKTETGLLNLYHRLDRLTQLNPLWINVTWGAQGSTSKATLEICAHALKFNGLDPLMHLTCTNMPKELVETTLKECRAKGIRNLLALRGDPAAANNGTWEKCEGGFEHAIDLVKFIREKHGDYFCIAVAGYPEGHLESPSLDEDMKHLKEKVDAGADLILTQLFFDNQVYWDFVQRARDAGIKIPIIPGVLPIQSYSGFMKFTSFCQTKVPQEILNELEKVRNDDQKVKDLGISVAVQMCRSLIRRGTSGLHFYTLNLEVSVTKIVEELGLAKPFLGGRVPLKQRVPIEFVATAVHQPLPEETSAQQSSRLESAQRAGVVEASGTTSAVVTDESNFDISRCNAAMCDNVRPIFWSNRPKSYVYRTQAWDDFPNGRWGSRHSPAFGEPIFSACTDPTTRSVSLRRQMWGEELTSPADVVRVFINYVKYGNPVKRHPWSSDRSLALETLLIKKSLVLLNQFGICTINSQPRVNGALSTDPIVGWGPKDGFVYQKAYLEFFCAPEVWHAVLTYLKEHRLDKDWSYAVIKHQGSATTHSGRRTSGSQGTVNAVTWGVFPNAEIIQPTVVDLHSFVAWRDEAFALWTVEWGSLYPPNSKSRRVIEHIHDEWYLVNIVDNNFVSGDLFNSVVEACQATLHPISENSHLASVTPPTQETAIGAHESSLEV